jgi:histidyl-tRNA synthetase
MPMSEHDSKSPAGMNDVLPKDHEYFTFIKKVVRHRCRQAGFKRITTPMFERTDVVKKALAEEADRIERSMYSIRDPEGTDLTLRSGNTIGIARAYVEHKFDEMPQPMFFYYIEPQARFTELKSGYYRHFHQFGLEVIGESDPALDAQVIYVANQINRDLSIDDRFELQINSMGDYAAREKYVADLKNFFIGKERGIPAEYRELIDRDPLQLFLIDDEDVQIICQLAPKIDQYWSEESKTYHEDLCEYLEELGISYKVNHTLFRRLPYYTETVFEFWEKNRGRDRAVGGGGRYDNLIERLGGKPTPAVNYSAGLERIVAQMKIKKAIVPSKDDIHVFVAQLGKEAKKKCLPLLTEMRQEGIKAIGAIGKSSMKEQIALAEKFKVPHMLLMGLTEVREGVAILREMKKGTQITLKLEDVIPELINRVGKDDLDKYTPGEVLY